MPLKLKQGERLVDLYNAKRTQEQVQEDSLYAPCVILCADGKIELVTYKGEGIASYANEKDFIVNNEVVFACCDEEHEMSAEECHQLRAFAFNDL